MRAASLNHTLRYCLPRAVWAQALLIQLVNLLLWSGLLHLVSLATWWFELQRLAGPHSFSWLCLSAYLLSVSLMTMYCGLPVWWRWIQPLFVMAVVGLQTLHIPNLVYLCAFLFTGLLYWTVYQTRVPFYPSFPSTWHALMRLLDQHAGSSRLQVLEIGSGLGDVAMSLARHRPQDSVAGVEIAPLPWLVSWCRAIFQNSQVDFRLGDYRQYDFSQQNVVFAYLSPAVMPALWLKASQEMRPGSLLISSEFPIPGVPESRCIHPAKGAPALYLYQFT